MAQLDESKLSELIDEVIPKRIDENLGIEVPGVSKILDLVKKIPDEILRQNPIKVKGILQSTFDRLEKNGSDSIAELTNLTSTRIKAAEEMLKTERIDQMWDFVNKYGNFESIINLTDAFQSHQESRSCHLEKDDFSNILKICKELNEKLLTDAGKDTGHSFSIFIDMSSSAFNESVSIIEKLENLLPDVLNSLPIDLKSIGQELQKLSDFQSSANDIIKTGESFHDKWEIAVPVLLAILDILFNAFVNAGRTFSADLTVGCFGGASVAAQGGIEVAIKPISLGNFIFSLAIGTVIRLIHQGLTVADKIVTLKIKEKKNEQLIDKISDAVIMKMNQKAQY